MKINAYAKINLTLDIIGKRDDGYHLLDSVMQSVSLFDIVSVEKADEISVLCSDNELSGEDNIAYKAAKCFFEYCGIGGGSDIYIEKHIPKAGGLGGGSTDAAAVIKALNTIYKTELLEAELCEIGLKVGADVPFCIVGKTARVEGIGEKLTPISNSLNLGVVLLKSGSKGSTAEMYRRIDSASVTMHTTTEAAIKAIENRDINALCKNIDNAFKNVSDCAKALEALQKTNPFVCSLSGSSPTCFALYSDLKLAEKAALSLEKEVGEVYFCEFI